MRVETLHAPAGIEVKPFVCGKCFREFEALWLFNKHQRESHQEAKVLSR